MNALDNLGRSPIHYLMKTHDFGTYENVELLEKLSGLSARLSQKDHSGRTPLDYAMEAGSRKMVAALQQLMGVAPQRLVCFSSR